jgi:hypothetical protein
VSPIETVDTALGRRIEGKQFLRGGLENSTAVDSSCVDHERDGRLAAISFQGESK